LQTPLPCTHEPEAFNSTRYAANRYYSFECCKDLFRSRPVRDVPSHMAPEDRALSPDDKGGGSSNLVPKQVVDAVPADYATFRVRKYGKPNPSQSCHFGGALDTVHADGHNLYVALLEQGVGACQLFKLTAADASKEAAVEDQNHSLVLLEQLGQGHFPAIGGGQ